MTPCPPLFPTLKRFYEEYEMPLARAFYSIEQRGIMVSAPRLDNFVKLLDSKLITECQGLQNIVGLTVVPKQPKGKKTPVGTLNISSHAQVRNVLTNILKIKLKKDFQSGNESTNEEALNEAFAKTGHPALKSIINVRELNKVKGTYAEVALVDGILYSIYHVAGTKGGRRSSTETPFTDSNGYNIGTNVQNLPKHSELGELFRECLIARPGKILLSADQSQAEDWVVSAIIADNGGGTAGLDELRKNIDRHRRLATQIFHKTWDECSKKSIERYLGKKTRHAGNYGMTAPRFAVVLIKEAPSFAEPMFMTGKLIGYCETLLREFHSVEPQIQAVFQNWVINNLKTDRTLTTPIGRNRYFFGLRPSHDNTKLFKEAFSYVPQSTIGDNTGLAVLFCESTQPGLVVMECHDSITLEVDADLKSVMNGVTLLREAFNRVLTFPNGTQIQIPLEFSLGYDLRNEVEFKEPTIVAVQNALKSLSRGPAECHDMLKIG